MEKINLTCVECPVGCSIDVSTEDGKVISITGNSCPRGKLYAENEVICPKRVVTSTVRSTDGRMLSVKTDRPVKKSNIFAVMKAINECVVTPPKKIGDVLIENIDDDANLIATDELSL